MKQEEWDRRYKSLQQGGTIKDMAVRCGLQYGTFGKWLHDNGLKVQNKRIGQLSIKLGRVSPYLHKRPQHEIDRVNHMERKLLETVKNPPKDWDGSIGSFLEVYVSEYGRSEK